MLIRADARQIPLRDACVQMVVTSPPYWGLRDYGTATWLGGDSACDHVERNARNDVSPEQLARRAEAYGTGQMDGSKVAPLQFRGACRKCGAHRQDNQIGLEPTPDAYVSSLVQVFREVKRVLKDDGVIWINLGDSYASGEIGRHDSRTEQAENYGARMAGPRQQMRMRSGLKPKDLVGVPWRVAFALQADGWYLRSDIIWCLSGGTRVYARTQKGDMPMTIKDLVRLNPATVKLWNGQKWTQALGWSETPRPTDTHELELRSGERIGCTAGHQWPTQRGNVRADELRLGDVLLTCELPEPEQPIRPDRLDDGVVGRFVGLYLAEGSRSGDTIQISSHQDEGTRFEALRTVAKAYHGTVAVHRTSAKGCTANLNGPILNAIVDTYIEGRTAKDKHLTARCWQRSDAFLRALLEGYLEADGHFDTGNNRWRLGFCQNDALAADLRTLCARLGVSLRLKRTLHQFAGRLFPGYRGQIRFSLSGHHNSKQDGEIVAIRRSRARKFWDIGVEDEPHLFALASGVLTHNSKPNPMPESVTDRPTKAHEYIFLLSKRATYYYDADAVSEPALMTGGGEQADAHTAKRNGMIPNRVGGDSSKSTLTFKSHTQRNKRSVWHVATQPYPDAHFATYPEKLIEPCILAGSKPGDLVFDPFIGSGTTGAVCDRLLRRWVGTDLTYQHLSKQRTAQRGLVFLTDDDEEEATA